MSTVEFLWAIARFAAVVFVEVFMTLIASLFAVLLVLGPIVGGYYLIGKARAAFEKWDRKHLDGQVSAAWAKQEATAK